MTARAAADADSRPVTLVWIDTEEAIVVRLLDGEASIERIGSEVPPRRRSIGHVRRDPTVRQGGGMAQDAHELHRLEHLTRFIDQVARHVSPDDDLEIIGPGVVRGDLERRVRAVDRQHHVQRAIAGEASARLTDPQLVHRLRERTGTSAPRGRRT